MTLLSGIPPVKYEPVKGDRVLAIWSENGRDVDLDGWVITLTPDLVRIAASPDDDGRPDPHDDWLRATFSRATTSFAKVR